jgi:hypothetical protein
MNALLSLASGTASEFAWFAVGQVEHETDYHHLAIFNEISRSVPLF